MTDAAVTPGMKGDGFYDAHSEFQRRIVEDAAQAIRTMVRALPLAEESDDVCTVVDYGCGTGATTAQSMGTALRALRERAPKIGLQASHADQVTNDFNQVFRTAAETYLRDVAAPLYISAVAGSFFGQVVPTGSVAVGLCSNAAHWFRKQPKVALPGGMYFSVAEGEARAELVQTAADDWLAFLSARASELERGGRLLVQGIGRIADVDGEHVSAEELLTLMWEIACGMADDNLLDRPTLVNYVFPVYCRSVEESLAPMGSGAPLRDSLEVCTAETKEIANPYWEEYQKTNDAAGYARSYTAFVRAFAESTLLNQLFRQAAVVPELACEEFFRRLEDAIRLAPERGRYRAWIVRLILARR